MIKYSCFFSVLVIFALACSPKKQELKHPAEALVQIPGVKANGPQPPVVVLLNTRPAPLQIEVPEKQGTKPVKKSGRDTILQLSPPVITPAHFFVSMPNYNTEQGLALSSVSKGYCDRLGNLWFCTEGAGVSRYDGKSFTTFNSIQGLANDVVWCVKEDKAGNLWFGTERGVSRYDGFSFFTFTTKDGLANNAVYNIEEDSFGCLWFATAGGLSRYNPARSAGGTENKNKSQDEKKLFINFAKADGLPSNRIWSLKQDSRGLLWIGTQLGLACCTPQNDSALAAARHSGAGKPFHFKTFSKQYGVPEDVIRDILEDSHGNIWYATYRGLVCLSKEAWLRLKDIQSPNDLSASNPCFITLGVADGLPGRALVTLHEDREGNLWCGTYGNGLSIFKHSSTTVPTKGSFLRITSKEGLRNDGVKSIIADKSGTIWISTEGGGVNAYPGHAFVSYSKTQGLAEDLIWAVLQDNNGNMLFGTNGAGLIGFNAYDETNAKVFTNYRRAQGLGFDFVWGLIKDRKGALWIGTFGGGVSRYDGKSFTTYTTEQGLCDNNIKYLTEDKAGNLWFGSLGKGLSCFDGKRFVNYTKAQGLVDNTIWSIAEGNEGSMWFATNDGLSRLLPDTVKADHVKREIINYTSAQGLPNNQVLCISKDSAGNLWFGTNGGGISRFDGKTFYSYSTNSGLCDNGVPAAIFDKRGNLAIGTNSGMALLKGFRRAGETKLLSTSNTLSNTELKELAPVFEVFSEKTGFPVKDVNTNSMYCDDRGMIWSGSGDKISCFDYSGVLRNADTLNLAIQTVKLNNENVCWSELPNTVQSRPAGAEPDSSAGRLEEVNLFGRLLRASERDSMRQKFGDVRFSGYGRFYPIPDHLVIPYNHNNVTLDFVAIEPARPFLVKYQYYLEGYDRDWNPVTDKTTATFGNIHEGTYTFKLKARSPEGVWSRPLTYVFTVLPPWYRSWWAYLIYAFFGVMVIGGFINMRLRVLRQEKEMLEKKVEERTVQLRIKNELVEKQKREVEKQKGVIEEKQKKILSSINYAKRIQDALLKEEEHVTMHLPLHFVLFKPKDIVSGDFYWALEKNDYWYIAAVDCTGHGVPGAFMSMLGVAFLNEITAVPEVLSPAQVLDHLRDKVLKELCQTGSASETKDGMDISLMRIDLKTREVQWAGAYNSLLITNAEGIREIKADRQPIGYYQNPQPFTNHTVLYQPGDEFYLYTDGYADQQNPDKVRISRKGFRDLLMTLHGKPMDVQKRELMAYLSRWAKTRAQTDDICVIGIRV